MRNGLRLVGGVVAGSMLLVGCSDPGAAPGQGRASAGSPGPLFELSLMETCQTSVGLPGDLSLSLVPGSLNTVQKLGGAYSSATAVNAAETFAGYVTVGGVRQAALIHQGDASWTLLGMPGGVRESFAYGINDREQVVGAAYVGGVPQPFLAIGGTAQLLPLPVGYAKGVAYAINNRGQVVGYVASAAGATQAFLWTPSAPNGATGTMVLLGEGTVAYGLNERGDVVGELKRAGTAFVWKAAAPNATTGSLQDIGRPSGFGTAVARDINAGGEVVGYGMDGGSRLTALYWNATQGWVVIGGLGSYTQSAAYSINDAGTVTGGSNRGTSGDDLNTRAFTWTNATRLLTELPKLLNTCGGMGFAVNECGIIAGQLGESGNIPFASRWGLCGVDQTTLLLVKTADAASVAAGNPIGFTMTVKNTGPFPASGVELTDPLPAGPGLSWSINPANPACTIANGTLTCDFGDLPAGASLSVHLTSTTTTQSCGTYGNTGTAQATNAPAQEASATTQVLCLDTPCPAGSFAYSLDGNGNLQIKYDQFPAPNDNSYGTNAVGWRHGHRFSDLFHSDHAGFELVDPRGVVRLSFDVDYLSESSSAPSGYKSLGVTGGDGMVIVGTADGISATTSLDRNLNGVNIPGLFNAGHVQQFGSVDVLVNSPPTDPAHVTYTISDPALAGWDFHDTYYVTVSAAKLAGLGFNLGTWKVQPNPTELHNSPPKPCPSTTATLSVTKYEVKDKQVKITIRNSGSTDVILTALTLQWPATANGMLTQVKLDNDVVYAGPALAGGTADLATAQLVADSNKRKIKHNGNDIYTLVFEKKADSDLSHYAGTVTLGGTFMTVLPH